MRKPRRRRLFEYETVTIARSVYPGDFWIDTPYGKRQVHAIDEGDLEHQKACWSMQSKEQYSEAELEKFFAGKDRDAMAAVRRETTAAIRRAKRAARRRAAAR